MAALGSQCTTPDKTFMVKNGPAWEVSVSAADTGPQGPRHRAFVWQMYVVPLGESGGIGPEDR